MDNARPHFETIERPNKSPKIVRVFTTTTRGQLPEPLKRSGYAPSPNPGGLPPRAFRASNEWGKGGRSAREPYNSLAIRLEVMADQKNR